MIQGQEFLFLWVTLVLVMIRLITFTQFIIVIGCSIALTIISYYFY
jgi:hypothetical protein